MDDTERDQTKFQQKDEHQVEEEANTTTSCPRRWTFLASDGGLALVNSMRKSLKASDSNFGRGEPPTIYKVPQKIREENEAAYEPGIVSIGPYHHGKESLKEMEEHKWRYLNKFLLRYPNCQLEDYLEEIMGLEDEARIRSSYSDHVGLLMGNEFVKMMVLDGCFVVQLFLKLKEEQSEEDPIFSMNWTLPFIGRDMLLLENQIPFFILQRILKMAIPNSCSLADLALDFFLYVLDDFMPREKKIPVMDSIHHLLHLFHSNFMMTLTPRKESNPSSNTTVESVPNKWKKLLMFLHSKGFLPSSNKSQLPISNSQSPQSPSPRAIRMIHCAAQLQFAGVKLKKNENGSSILDVKFSHGVLEIPPLSIDDTTRILLQNLVAFEQCYQKVGNHFTTYVWFMDCLINTSKDVALLHREGIIDHVLGSDEEVANLFNELGNGTTNSIENNYLSGLYKDVEKHCKTKWNMWRASLVRDYFTNPWACLSSVAAAILLLLTIAQTFFTILPYFQNRS